MESFLWLGTSSLSSKYQALTASCLQKGYERTVLGNFNNECIWRTKITKQESLLSHILGTKQITKFLC